jgi:alpha-tubulin suppressor-like RCC1 family protein
MVCWGDGGAGALGNGGSSGTVLAPAPLGGGFATKVWISLDCGSFFTAAIDNVGRLHTWGTDTVGELAQTLSPGTIKNIPDSVMGTGSSLPAFVQVAAGWNTVCACTTTKRMFCAGQGGNGQTGTGSTIPWASYDVMTEVDTTITTWEWGPYMYMDTVVAGMNTASPLDLRAWGWNDVSQSGRDNVGNPYAELVSPMTLTYLPTTFSAYSVGYRHACGVDSAGTGKVFCIGDNMYGR